ncbi:MAG: PEP-CTERM sorting domain-containing protein [Verrucomicrobia bacterium]|nr:PEP-CTERM sorting domain-containing protein [Verrucomicrobiota bacterium]
MRFPQRLIAGLVLMLVSVAGVHAQFIWSGQGATRQITDAGNWQGLVAPPNDGTAVLYLGKGLHDTLLLGSNYDLDTIIVAGGQTFSIDSAAPITVNIGSGILSSDLLGNYLSFGSNITLNISGSQVFDTKAGTTRISGGIAGTGSLALVQTSNDSNYTGTFIFNNTSTGNTYTGGTTLGDGTNSVGVAFWNSSPFGTGNVDILVPNAGVITLISHGYQTLNNNLTVTQVNPSSGQITFRSWDSPLVFDGTVTLATSSIFASGFTQNVIPAPDNSGSVPVPGMFSRNPIMFTNAITESGGSRSLVFNGTNVFFLTGSNTYTGGTTVNGSLVFGSLGAVPTTGTITVNTGYVGFGDTTANSFATFLSTYIPVGSTGAIGLDTLPGNPTQTFSDPINLSSFSTSIRIGSATSANLAGTITPNAGGFRFGGGGGRLNVQSSLAGAFGLTLFSNNGNIPLTVYLQGTNSYTGFTNVNNGFLIFDSGGAFSSGAPAQSLTATGAANNVGASYIGYTGGTSFTPSTFLSNFNQANTWGIIGFDTGATAISSLNLTGFNDGVFIGTTTSAQIDGSTLTGTTVTNGSNAANTLRFTAALGGVLTVTGPIIDGASPKAVMIGSPSPSGPYSGGTVILSDANSYTGGTTVNAANIASITLGVGNSAALGTGPLTFTSGSGNLAGLKATTTGINLPNAITLYNSAPGTGSGPLVYFTGSNDFTLSGSITGDATTSLNMYNSTPIAVTLSGNNSAFLGNITLYNGTLNLLNNYAAGGGSIFFGLAGSGLLTFGGAATNPVIYGLSGDSGTISIPGGTNLNYDISYGDNRDTDYGGTITGAGSLTLTAPTSPNMQGALLSGNNTYSGGTTVLNNAILALGSNTGAGSGTVVVNAPGGGLALNSGVTFTNPLTFTAGSLLGWGTFAPTGTSTFTFDTNHAVAPGLAGADQNDGGVVGTLTLNADVVFADGGTFKYAIKDPSTPDGLALLAINGNLNITASPGGFTLKLFTYDTANTLGFANLTLGNTYNIPIATISGSITGFSPTAFTIDATNFQLGQWSPTVFSLSQSGGTLYLNFTAVPEPSTYALLALGLGTLVLPGFRRRRQSR